MTFWKKHHFDFIFILLLLIIVSLEIRQAISISFSCSDDNCLFENLSERYYINYILITIIPLVDTIITVCITFPSTNIYGVRYSEFRRLRGKWEYSLTSMIIISLILLALTIVSYYLSLFITTILLNVYALVYAIIFCAKEIPILVESKRRIYRIVRNCFIDLHLKDTDSHTLDYAHKDNLLSNVTTYMLFNFGLYQTHLALSKKHIHFNDEDDYNVALLYYLLREQNKYLNSLRNDYVLLKNVSTLGTYKNISITDAIGKSIQNIIDLLSDDDNPLRSVFIKFNNVKMNFYDSVFAIYYVLKKFDLLDDYHSKIKKIICMTLPKEDSDKTDESYNDCLKQISDEMVVHSLKIKSVWYFDFLANIYNDSEPRYKYNLSYDFCLYSSLCLFYSSQLYSKDKKFVDKVTKFINCKFATVIRNITKEVRSITYKIKTLDNLMDFYSSGSKPTFIWYDFVVKRDFENFSDPFNEIYLLHWWVGYLFMDFMNPSESEINDIVGALDKHKKTLGKYSSKFFDYDWFYEESELYNKKMYDYFKAFFGIDIYDRVKSNRQIIVNIQNKLSNKESLDLYFQSEISSERKIYDYITNEIKKAPYYVSREELPRGSVGYGMDIECYLPSDEIQLAFGVDNYDNYADNMHKHILNTIFSNLSANEDDKKVHIELLDSFECKKISYDEYQKHCKSDEQSKVNKNQIFFYIKIEIIYTILNTP